VNAICPAFTDTAMVQNSIMQDKEYGQRLVMMNPMRRLGEPEEVTSVIMFMCSDQNTFMNGQAIAIDGGLMAM
jgi:NAD(P)-dependent dehydrogenase (short-subunit alcohol dehydrogenase family)